MAAALGQSDLVATVPSRTATDPAQTWFRSLLSKPQAAIDAVEGVQKSRNLHNQATGVAPFRPSALHRIGSGV